GASRAQSRGHDRASHRARHARGDGLGGARRRPSPRRKGGRGHARGGQPRSAYDRALSWAAEVGRMTEGAPLLDVENLDVFYGEARALDGVSLRLARGEIVSVVGANGAGKTTLIRTLAGMQRPAQGTIRYGRVDIA